MTRNESFGLGLSDQVTGTTADQHERDTRTHDLGYRRF